MFEVEYVLVFLLDIVIEFGINLGSRYSYGFKMANGVEFLFNFKGSYLRFVVVGNFRIRVSIIVWKLRYSYLLFLVDDISLLNKM